jgi:hypothetical protein
MMIKRCFALVLSLLATSPLMAEETWTDLDRSRHLPVRPRNRRRRADP